MEFNTVSISDGITMGTEGMKMSLVSREVIADSIELVARGNQFDGIVALVGCDKTIPGAIMALARLNIPGLVLYGGSIAPGSYHGHDVTIQEHLRPKQDEEREQTVGQQRQRCLPLQRPRVQLLLREALRLIACDDGELIVRTLVPDVIHAAVPTSIHLEIKTKLGAKFSARQVVVTIEDPHGNATAQTAMMHSDQTGHYVFHHRFAEPGPYIVRIFPSETETVSTIELDVES